MKHYNFHVYIFSFYKNLYHFKIMYTLHVKQEDFLLNLLSNFGFFKVRVYSLFSGIDPKKVELLKPSGTRPGKS